MKNTSYRHVDQVGSDNSQTGAYGNVNRPWDSEKKGKWYIEEQRIASEAIAAGIAQNNIEAIKRGFKILEWGFAQQKMDGSFDCKDNFHSTSFFVEAAAHSILLLNKSSFHDQFKEQIDILVPKLLKSALWMIRPEIEYAGKTNNFQYAHRNFLVGAALGEAGIVTNNNSLIEKSNQWIKEGLSKQNIAGFNYEKGGYDSTYQAVGLLFAMRLRSYQDNTTLDPSFDLMIEKGISWLKSRVLSDGSIDVNGNTRTGLNQEKKRDGTSKGVAYGQIYRALGFWSVVSHDKDVEKIAYNVFNADRRQKKYIK